MNITKLFNEFFYSEKIGGVLLILCTIISIIVSNSALSEYYFSIWNFQIAGHSFVHAINDGLMAVFFLLIGLELEREILIGELKTLKMAMLPIFAAIGGMVAPFLFFSIFNFGKETSSGAGIPTATDIAFALGVLSLLGKRVPLALKVFLTAFAVIDDLGAIIIIAVFYTKTVRNCFELIKKE